MQLALAIDSVYDLHATNCLNDYSKNHIVITELPFLYQQLIRGVKVRPAAAREQANNGSGVLGKHKHGGHERAGASGGSGDCVDGTGKYDGACKSRSPHAAVRRARQEAVSI
jgi:hypothetical protein